MKTTLPTKRGARGFTVVELIVVVTVLGILIGVVLGTLGDFYQANTTSLGQTTQDTDTRGVLRSIENELASSAGFVANLPVASPLGPTNAAGTWSHKGNDAANLANRRVLIATAYATDILAANDADNERLPIMLQGNGCDYGNTSPAPEYAKNAYIYFVARDPQNSSQYNLYRRTVVGINGTSYCFGKTPAQKQTCAPASIAANPSVCKGPDAVLLRDVESLKVDYYASSNDTAPADAYSSGDKTALITGAKTAVITVTTNHRIDGRDTQNTASIRISRSY